MKSIRRALIAAAVTGILMSTGQCMSAEPITNSGVTANSLVAGRTLVEWLQRADLWWRRNADPEAEFALSSREHANVLAPSALTCLTKSGNSDVATALAADNPGRSNDELNELSRSAALSMLFALGKSASVVAPDLVKLLQDREWKDRIFVANAFKFIGPAATMAKTTAIEDLDSPSESIRQQGCIVAAACANYDEEMVGKLVLCTRDTSKIVRHTALSFLSHLVYKTPQAAPALFRVLERNDEDSAQVKVILRLREAERQRGQIANTQHNQAGTSMKAM